MKHHLSILLPLLLAGCVPSRPQVPPKLDGGVDGGGQVDLLPSQYDFARRDGDSVTNETIYAQEGQTLYIVHPTTYDLTTVGTFGVTDDMTDLAITATGEIYTVSRTSLYQVDGNTAKATLLLATINTSTSNVALTFLVDGTLLAADQAGKVRSIDPKSGVIVELGSYGSGFDTAGDLVVVADGTMFGISAKGPFTTTTSNALLKVNPQTGVAQGVGSIGFIGVFGIAYSGGRVLAFTKTGDIIQINPQTGVGTLVRSYPTKVFYGAGTSPLVPIQ